MALPLLGLLAVQGARTIATRIAGSAATRRKVAEILAKNFKKAQKESLSKGKIPTDKTLTQGLTKDQKGLLSNLNPTPGKIFKSSIPSKAEMKAAKKAAKYTFKGPVPDAAGRAAAAQGAKASRASQIVNENISRQAANNQRIAAQNARIQNETAAQARNVQGAIKSRQAAYGRSPITQTADAGLTRRESLGLLGGATAVPLIGGAIGGFANQETPQQISASTPLPATEPAPRFMQVINPGYESTGKEVLNAALLRAGLRMMNGGNLRETIDAAASVADSKNIFRSGEQALAAGRRNLGEAAQITVGQNADGTFSYRGTLDANPVAQMDAIVNETQKREGKPRIITKQVLEVAMRANPSKSEEEVIAELEKAGFTNPTE